MICLQCEREFEPRKHNTKYCNDKCREKASNNRNYSKNRSRNLKAHRLRRYKLKIEVLTHYGPAGILGCCCEGCEICDIDMLTLDHVSNDGYKERQGFNRPPSTDLYFRVKKNGFPVGFQTLCWNHQWKKEITRLRDSRID
jgi:hypothetical protein